MMFNADKGAAERKIKALVIFGIVVWFAVVSSIAFVAVHFIVKFW